MRQLTIALAALVLVSIAGPAVADISPHISFQGVIRDNEGNVVPDGSYKITFRIYEVPSGGGAIWTEVDTCDVQDGIVNATLGTSTPLSTISWEIPYWLGISIENEDELVPRTEMTSVPYAAHAGFADTAGEDADWTISGDDMYSAVDGGVGIGDTTPEWLFDIHLPSLANNYMQITNSATGDATYSGLLMGVGTEAGWIAYSGPSALRVGRGSSANSVNIYSSGDVSVGMIATPDAKLDVDGDVKMTGFKMPTGAVDGYVLTSDGNGVGTWEPLLIKASARSAAGNVVLDEKGEALVTVPESLAKSGEDLRYQLTCVGGFAPVYVAQKARGGVFRIAGGEPGMEISWQVSGAQ